MIIHTYIHRPNSFLITERCWFATGIILSTVLYSNRPHKNNPNSSSPSLILERRVCFGISPAHLDTAKRHFMCQDSVITRAPPNKESSGKCKCKHWQSVNEHTDTNAMLWLYLIPCVSLLFSIFSIGWHFQGKKKKNHKSFAKLTPWLNTHICPTGHRLTFNIWIAKSKSSNQDNSQEVFCSAVVMVSYCNPEGNWDGSSGWDVYGTEWQSSAKMPVKDITIALGLHEPWFNHDLQKVEEFSPHRSPYNWKRKK